MTRVWFLRRRPWSVDRGLSAASVGRGSGGFVDPVPEELLDSCRLADHGKASTTAFTMCGISSVVNGSFLLCFSAGKDLEDLSRCATEGGIVPLRQQFAYSRFTCFYECSCRKWNSNSHYSEVSQRQRGYTAHALLIFN